jgi:hypothetical protein
MLGRGRIRDILGFIRDILGCIRDILGCIRDILGCIRSTRDILGTCSGHVRTWTY